MSSELLSARGTIARGGELEFVRGQIHASREKNGKTLKIGKRFFVTFFDYREKLVISKERGKKWMKMAIFFDGWLVRLTKKNAA